MAEEQLRHVEDNARQAVPTMHEELNELRRTLRVQEDTRARTRSEVEAARLAPSTQCSTCTIKYTHLVENY